MSLHRAGCPSPGASPDAGYGTRASVVFVALGKCSFGLNKLVHLLFISQSRGKPRFYVYFFGEVCRNTAGSSRAAVREMSW